MVADSWLPLSPPRHTNTHSPPPPLREEMMNPLCGPASVMDSNYTHTHGHVCTNTRFCLILHPTEPRRVWFYDPLGLHQPCRAFFLQTRGSHDLTMTRLCFIFTPPDKASFQNLRIPDEVSLLCVHMSGEKHRLSSPDACV